MIGRKTILAMAGAIIFASAIADTQTVDGVTWTYTVRDGEAVLGTGNSWQPAISPRPSSVTIPENLGGYPVREIGNAAFYGCQEIKEVKIPTSVRVIGPYGFDGTGLKEIVIPEGVTNIQYCAFDDCTSLESISISSTVTSIGSLVFYRCAKLSAFSVAADNPTYKAVDGFLLTKDGKRLLRGPSIAEAEIPVGVETVDDHAFHGCDNLQRVKIPLSVRQIGESAFACCQKLVDVSVEDGNDYYKTMNGFLLTSDGKTAVHYFFNESSVRVPEGVETLGGNLFADKTGMKEVYLPDSVTRIESQAFWDCYALASISLPSNLMSIGSGAFTSCALKEIIIPASVTSIGQVAFQGCGSLNAVFFQGNAPSYAYQPFPWLKATVYVLPGSTGWKSEGSAELPETWPAEDYGALPIQALEGSYEIVYELGAHGQRTGGGALVQSVAAGSAPVEPVVAVEEGWEWMGWNETVTFVHEDKVVRARYKKEGAFDDGEDYEESVNGYTWTFDVVDGEAWITGCMEDPVGHLDIPGELGGCPVVALGESLFDNDYRRTPEFKSVTIPASVAVIENYVFYGCPALMYVTYEGDESAIVFGRGVFSGTPYEEGWAVPVLMIENHEVIGLAYSWEGDSCLTDGVLEIPSDVTSVRAHALEGLALWNLEKVVIPASVKSIGDFAFGWCEMLQTVAFENEGGCEVSETAFAGTPWKLAHGGWRLPFVRNDGGTLVVTFETVTNSVPCAVVDGTLEIPEGVDAVPEKAISEVGDVRITRIACPSTLAKIAPAAFALCPYLSEVALKSLSVGIFCDAFGEDEEILDWLCFTLDSDSQLIGGWNVFSDGSVPAPNPSVYTGGGAEVFHLGAGYVATPFAKTLKVGPGLLSTFTIGGGACCSSKSERAVIAGVAGADWSDFSNVPYLGNGYGSVSSCLCLTYSGIVDVEKTMASDSDDYSCWELPKINMAYWGGYVSKAAYPTEDAVADEYRANDCWWSVFDWLEVPTNRIDWAYYDSGVADINEFIVRHLKDGNALVELTTWESSHGVTCCGYVCDESRNLSDPGYLTGLFIVDSDNDMYVNGGGAGAPNRITYCPVKWDGEAYLIGNVWGLEWDGFDLHCALWAKGADPTAVRLEQAKDDAVAAIEDAANEVADGESGWNAALRALVKDAEAAVYAATTIPAVEAAGKAGVERVRAFLEDASCTMRGTISNYGLYEDVSVEFRRITAVGHTVWSEVAPDGTYEAALSAGDWQVTVWATRVSDGAEYTTTESVTVSSGEAALDIELPADEYLGNASVDTDDAGKFWDVGVGGLADVARKAAATAEKSVAFELKVTDPELYEESAEVPVLLMAASVPAALGSAPVPSTRETVERLRAAAVAAGADDRSRIDFLKLSLARSDDGGDTWSQVDSLKDDTVEVTIPLEFDEKMDFTILRSDGGEIDRVRQIVDNGPSAPAAAGTDEGFRVEPGKVVLQVSRFAVFAIVSAAPRGRLYPDGDGAFAVPAAAVSYEGVVLRDGAVAGTLTAKVSKPNAKKGSVADVTLKVKTIGKANLQFKAKKVALPGTGGRFALEPANAKSAAFGAASLVISGDSLTGSFANGFEIDAVRNVFKTKGDPKRGRVQRYVQGGRSWCVALGADAPGLGYAAIGVKVAANGKVKVKGHMGDGVKVSASATAEIGQGWLAVPVMVNKKSGGELKTFGFRVSLDEASGKVGVANATDYAGAEFSVVASGLPELTKAVVQAATVEVSAGNALPSRPDKVKLSYKDKTGEIGGTVTWQNVAGKKKLSGKVYGVVVGNQGFGEIVVKGVGSFKFMLVLR